MDSNSLLKNWANTCCFILFLMGNKVATMFKFGNTCFDTMINC